MNPQRTLYSPQSLVRHLREEGVLFQLMDEEEAVHYLTGSTNFFKINTYKKNYASHLENGKRRYDSLEFAYLKELDNIDRSLRRVCSAMCLDVEHCIKVRLLSLAHEDPSEDGYRLVRAFSDSLGGGRHALENEIERNSENPYCAAVTAKYDIHDLPLWAFVEVIPFGRLLRLYQFAAQERSLAKDARLAELLELVRDLRNAVAHNNCLLCDLTPKRPDEAFYLSPPAPLRNALEQLRLTREQAQLRLSNPRIAQITALLYIHPHLVTDPEMRQDAYRELREVVDGRMPLRGVYFAGNALLRDCYRLLKREMDAWCR